MTSNSTLESATLSQRAGRSPNVPSSLAEDIDENDFIEVRPHQSFWVSVIDSFRRNPRSWHPKTTTTLAGSPVLYRKISYDVSEANAAAAASPLSRGLESRHLQMMAICGTIGYGLFVTSGATLAYAGPASLCLAFALGGLVLLCTVYALGELAIMYPVAGSFAQYSIRFIDPSWGFAMGWNYALHWWILLPTEIVVANITIYYWFSNGTDLTALFVTLFLGLTITLNLFPVKVYGESEFYFSIIKVATIIGYIILGIIINIGGGDNGAYIGFKYWNNPGSFSHGFKGFCYSLTTVTSAYGGIEIIGLNAAEAADPRRVLPRAIKQVFWRIFLFYTVSIFIVCTLVPYTEPHLTEATGTAGVRVSPFVLSITNTGIQVFPSIMNAAIMLAVVSLANTSTYAASRMLAALAEQRLAPSFFAYIDRAGRPTLAVLVVSLTGGLAYIGVSNIRLSAFSWMASFTGLSSVFTWLTINIAHLRFRRAWAYHGHTLEALPYRSPLGTWGSIFGIIGNIILLMSKFWVSLFPPGYGDLNAHDRATAFFQGYLTLPVLVTLYVGHKLLRRTRYIKTENMDILTGNNISGGKFRQPSLRDLMAEEKAEKKTWPRWKKIYRILC